MKMMRDSNGVEVKERDYVTITIISPQIGVVCAIRHIDRLASTVRVVWLMDGATSIYWYNAKQIRKLEPEELI